MSKNDFNLSDTLKNLGKRFGLDDDLMRDAFDLAKKRQAAEKKTVTLPNVRRKIVDGVAYLRADDVVALLDALDKAYTAPGAARLAEKLRSS